MLILDEDEHYFIYNLLNPISHEIYAVHLADECYGQTLDNASIKYERKQINFFWN